MGLPVRNEALWVYGSSRELAELFALIGLSCSVNIMHRFRWRSVLLPDVPVKLAGDGNGASTRRWSALALSMRQRGESTTRRLT